MDIHSSSQPDVDVAQALSEQIEKHKNTPLLLLLAGGSALQILDLLDTAYINEYVTIMMMDERYSSNPEENNFLQMTLTAFYTITKMQGVTFIPSVPTVEETHEDFTCRIESQLKNYITETPEVTVFALFGIGPDGHTAGIFPMEKESFVDTYGQGQLYTKVVYDKNSSPLRTSITPKFITTYITKSLVYATGEGKRPILQTISDPYELHELPSHIHKQIDSELFTDLTIT